MRIDQIFENDWVRKVFEKDGVEKIFKQDGVCQLPQPTCSRYMSVGEPDYEPPTLQIQIRNAALCIICIHW